MATAILFDPSAPGSLITSTTAITTPPATPTTIILTSTLTPSSTPTPTTTSNSTLLTNTAQPSLSHTDKTWLITLFALVLLFFGILLFLLFKYTCTRAGRRKGHAVTDGRFELQQQMRRARDVDGLVLGPVPDSPPYPVPATPTVTPPTPRVEEGFVCVPLREEGEEGQEQGQEQGKRKSKIEARFSRWWPLPPWGLARPVVAEEGVYKPYRQSVVYK